MKSKMTRRDALKLGTGTALSAAIGHSATATGRNTATPNSGDEICFMRAVDMVDAIRTKKLSAREVMQAHLQQIQRVNAKVNAMVTMVPEEQLMAQAAAADEALAHGKWLGPCMAFTGCGQRPARNQWHPHHLWLSAAQRLCAGFRLPGGAAGERGGSDRPGQDERARIRSRFADLQSGLRARPTIPTTPPRHAAEAPAAARSRSHAVWLPWPTAATWAALCAILPTSATWWASAPRQDACRTCLPT
jgi:hypothetical protein